MKGYVVVPQFYNYATTWKELLYGERKGDALAYESVVHALGSLTVHPTIPHCPFGCIVFRIEEDDRLSLVLHHYDSSG